MEELTIYVIYKEDKGFLKEDTLAGDFEGNYYSCGNIMFDTDLNEYTQTFLNLDQAVNLCTKIEADYVLSIVYTRYL